VVGAVGNEANEQVQDRPTMVIYGMSNAGGGKLAEMMR